MHVHEVTTRPELPLDQRAFACMAGSEPLLDIYEFDATGAAQVIWPGKIDLPLYLDAVVGIMRDVHQSIGEEGVPALLITYATAQEMEQFAWTPESARSRKHRAFLRDHGYAVTYAHCETSTAYPCVLWAQLLAPLAGQIGYCGPIAPESVYALMRRTGTPELQRYDDDLRVFVERHMERMRDRAR